MVQIIFEIDWRCMLLQQRLQRSQLQGKLTLLYHIC